MANENYENVNDKMQGQTDENQQKSIKTHDMLEALEKSMDVARGTLTKAFKEIRKEHPQYDIGSALRRFHLPFLKPSSTNLWSPSISCSVSSVSLSPTASLKKIRKHSATIPLTTINQSGTQTSHRPLGGGFSSIILVTNLNTHTQQGVTK